MWSRREKGRLKREQESEEAGGRKVDQRENRRVRSNREKDRPKREQERLRKRPAKRKKKTILKK